MEITKKNEAKKIKTGKKQRNLKKIKDRSFW
jgi:hypothetical protein